MEIFRSTIFYYCRIQKEVIMEFYRKHILAGYNFYRKFQKLNWQASSIRDLSIKFSYPYCHQESNQTKKRNKADPICKCLIPGNFKIIVFITCKLHHLIILTELKVRVVKITVIFFRVNKTSRIYHIVKDSPSCLNLICNSDDISEQSIPLS